MIINFHENPNAKKLMLQNKSNFHLFFCVLHDIYTN